MEQVKSRSARIVIVVAMALIVHVWMLNASMAPPDVDARADHTPVLMAPATPHLPATSHCTAGRSACLVSEPDGRPTAITLALLVAVGGSLWTLHLLVPDLERRRTQARRERCPPRPCVHASVVLLQ